MTYYTDKEVLRKALTALESCSGAPHWKELQPAITAIKQSLAAPVQKLTLDSYDEHYNTTPPAAQPAIPDAITDNSESPEYRAGWTECREVMAGMLRGKP
jgi:hypothetical protein